MIKAHVSYTEEHFRALSRSLRRKDRKSETFWRIVRALIVILVATEMIYVNAKGIELAPRSKLTLLLLGAVAVFDVGLEVYLLTVPRRAAGRQRRTGSAIDFTFGSEGMKAESGDESMSFPWETLLRAEHSGRYFIIFRTEKTAFMIGDADITEGTPDGLEQLLRERLGERFKKY